jgi:hypothetical protein
VRLPDLPAGFSTTREGLRALACYVIAPARKARTGHIGLEPVAEGFGTPPTGDGFRLAVRGASLVREPGGETAPIVTLRGAAEFAGVELLSDPGVGTDIPAFRPDDDLGVEEAGSLALGTWYRFGAGVIDGLRREGRRVGDTQLWPEHFDLAATFEGIAGAKTNVGFSPGDGYSDEPYLYAGPWDTSAIEGEFWNAPFGASVRRSVLLATSDPGGSARDFVETALHLVG